MKSHIEIINFLSRHYPNALALYLGYHSHRQRIPNTEFITEEGARELVGMMKHAFGHVGIEFFGNVISQKRREQEELLSYYIVSYTLEPKE